MATRPDVLILGGGIIGLTAAYFLAKAGAKVRVIERSEFGREASWAGAGILPPFGEPLLAGSSIDQLRAQSVSQFQQFSAELRELTGIDNGYRITGGLEKLDAESVYARELWVQERIPFELVDTELLRALEPELNSPNSDLDCLPGFAQVRNPWHTRALMAACQSHNVDLRANTPVEQWKMERGEVAGVIDSACELHSAEHYLLANGPWAEPFLQALGLNLGLHPVRGQILLLHAPHIRLSRVVLDGKRYLVPRGDGHILTGSTEEPEAGFAKATTDTGLNDLFSFARSWLPRLTRGDIEKSWAGLRPVSRDGLPAIGMVPNHPNVSVAVGHGRAGVQLSLGTAELMLNQWQGRLLPKYAVAFRPDRLPATPPRPAFRS